MSKVLIVGGGAAGMFASITAARNGHEVCLFEKNEKLGKKLFITGKGRCNITNACDMETLFSSVTSNSKFLYSSFYGCTNGDVIQFFEGLGVRTKVERGDRVFPASDHSSDVIGAMEKEMRRLHIDVHLSTGVSRVKAEDGRFSCVELANVLLPPEGSLIHPQVLPGTVTGLHGSAGMRSQRVCRRLCLWK